MRSSLPTSHGFVPLKATQNKSVFNPMPSMEGRNLFAAQFEYTGTIDTAPTLCIPAALKFRGDICGGEDRIRAYRFELAEEGEKRVVEILGTKALPISNGSRVNFANFWLPLSIASPGESDSPGRIPREDIPLVTEFMNQKFVDEYNCYVSIIFYNDAWLARFSAEIYLDLDDFVYGAQVLKTLCERVRRYEYKLEQ